MTRKNSINMWKWTALLAALLVTAALPGCFNPAYIETPVSADPVDHSSDDDALGSFTITVAIGNSQEASRAAVGPDYDAIKYGPIRNFVQIIVVDEEGKLADFEEAHREDPGDTTAVLRVIVPPGKTYHFLALMGCRDSDEPPTLLAAGFKTMPIGTTQTRIQILMQPLVVDACFTSERVPLGWPDEKKTVEARTGKKSPLLLGDEWGAWKIEWTIQKGFVYGAGDTAPGGDGLETLLTARKAIDSEATEPVFKSKRWTNNGVEAQGQISVEGQRVSWTLENLVVNAEGAVNFKLEYVPFGGSANFDWSGYNEESELNLAEEGPVWIIRNGINDAAQDGSTDFTHVGVDGKNGNGGVKYKALDPKGNEDGDDFINRDEMEIGTDPFVPDSDGAGLGIKIEW
ncbi:MAG: hypothetical protein LBH70_00620 [Spirochaetaceae bacterium]|nr:hypothetical protein [Spirochaetaceae bacterium]